MKRDVNIIRQILLNTEADKYQYGGRVRVDGISDEICARHVALIFDEGLAEGRLIKTNAHGIVGASIDRLTSAGHDFLDAARNDDVWNATKTRIGQAGSWTLRLVLDILKEEAKRRLGL